jgi:hypothetical protein
MVFVLGIALLGPALFYRWSLKGSSLIYSPLVWVVHSATARPLRDHLQDIHELAVYRISRWFASFVLLLFAAKFYVYFAWGDLGPSWHAIPGHRLLDALVMPKAFPFWQITSAVNAILAWILYLAADWVVARWKRGSRINEKVIAAMLRWISLVRGGLSVYAIVCGIYLAAALSGRFNLPTMGTGIFPWQ